MKKISKILVATLLMFTITGCSFLEGFMGGDNSGAYSYVSDKKIKELNVDRTNRKTTYVQGDEFVKPKVTAAYEDGTEEDVTNKCEFSGYNMNVVGEQKVTVKYENWTITYTITIYEASTGKVATKIALDEGFKTQYFTGDTFVKPKIIGTFEDGTTDDITDKCEFSTVDMNLVGKQTVSVKYQRFTISFSITITEKYAREQRNYYINCYEKTIVVDESYRLYYYRKGEDGAEDIVFDNETISSGGQYSVEDASIVSVNEKGEFAGLKAGETYIHCSRIVSGEIYFDFRCLVKVEVKKPKSLEIINYRDKYYTNQIFNFMCKARVTYQTGYQENIEPSVDSSKVNMNVPGNYNITIYYSLNNESVSVIKSVTVLDSSLYTIEKTELDFHLRDYWDTYRISALPTLGETKMLVIPVRFTDSDEFITNYNYVREDINTTFFGTNEELGWRSVKTFYEEESKGLVTIGGLTSEWFEPGISYKDCYNTTNIYKLRDDAVEWFFSTHPSEDRKSYDADHDGYLDGLVLIHGCPDYSTGQLQGEGAGNLWAMVKSFNDKNPDLEKPSSVKFMWASYDYIYPSKAKALERTGKSEYSEPGRYSTTGYTFWTLDVRTFIHETGHMFGLNDFYSTTEDGIYPAGHTNIQTLNFLSHDPYALLQYGWANPYIPEFTQTISITDFQDNHDVIMLKPNNSAINSTFDEYILVDLYAPTGLNKFNSVDHPIYYGPGPRDQKDLTTVGVRIWHVDARLLTAASDYTEFTTDPTNGKTKMSISNSYYEEAPENIREFLELELIRNDTEIDYRHLSYNKWTDYFYEGDEFDMTKFPKQFANGTKLDSGLDLGWSIKVDGIYQVGDKYSADITVTKL